MKSLLFLVSLLIIGSAHADGPEDQSGLNSGPVQCLMMDESIRVIPQRYYCLRHYMGLPIGHSNQPAPSWLYAADSGPVICELLPDKAIVITDDGLFCRDTLNGGVIDYATPEGFAYFDFMAAMEADSANQRPYKPVEENASAEESPADGSPRAKDSP